MSTYKIKKGDTLYKIAKEHGTTVNELASLNKIANPRLIYAGADLTLPGAPTTQQPEVQTQANPVQSPPPAAPPSTIDLLAKHESQAPQYQQSPALEAALEQLKEYGANKPGEYQSQYSDQIGAMLDDILNREDFAYNFDADPLYQQYKNQYQQQGERAMLDTMGNAAQLSGGYGNSYAHTVGQQQYNEQMQQLNNVIPALRDAAYNMYKAEGDEMKNELAVLEGMDQKEYGLYRDEVNDYNQEYNRLYNEAQDMANEEYTKHLNDYKAWESDRDYQYNKSQDEQAQENWQTQWDYKQQMDALAMASKASGRGGGNGGDETTEQSKGYDDALKRAKMMSVSDAKAYLQGLVSGYENENSEWVDTGHITRDECVYIYQVVLGGSIDGDNTQDKGSKTSVGVIPPNYTGTAFSIYYKNGKPIRGNDELQRRRGF